MKVSIEVELQPFQAPNFVRSVPKEGERGEGDCYPLSALDANTLDKLCDDFRREVFRKAGQQQPPVPG